MAPSAKTLEIVAVMSESILIGAYAVLTALVIWLLVTRRRGMPKMHKVLFGASVVMFLISVTHLALVMEQTASGTLSIQNARARILLSVFQFIIGDLVLIWRVWVIWDHNYWVAGPPLAIMIVAAGFTFNLASFHKFTTFFVVAPTALIVANTSICTLLIAGKIWYARYQLRLASGGSMYSSGAFNGTVALFIESGALVATCQTLSLVLDHIKSDGIHILLDLEIPLIGILPTLIIVFVHFELVGHSSSRSVSFPSIDGIKFQDRDQVDLGASTSTMASGGTEQEDKSRGYPHYDTHTQRVSSMA